MRGVVAAVCVAVIAAIGVSLTGCAGYQFGSTYRQEYGTIAVPIFGNTTYQYGYESEVTDAVIKEIHRTTPYKVVAASDADTVLSGTIIGADLQNLVNDSETGLVQELAVILTVNFEWRDSRSGELLLGRRGYSASGLFVPDFDAAERLETGQSRAADRLAKDLVRELRSAW
ncbi:MAG: LptE family protein [Planctomycetota bacterium]